MITDNLYAKYILKHHYHRLAAIFYVIATLIYLTFLATNLNYRALYVSLPFFLTQAFGFLLVSLTIINNWKGKYRTERPPLPLEVPAVGIIVPTYKEPIPVLRNTLRSLLNISYPGKIVILLSNDDKSKVQQKNLVSLMRELSVYWERIYQTSVESSEKEMPGMVGKRSLFLINTKAHKFAKAGNLNQATQFFRKYFPQIDLILTQDADEEVYKDFFLATVGYFTDQKVAYVQTIKQAAVSAEDPFGNRDLMWYARSAASRDADNAMFACGSGVIWRLSAVESVGGFDTWNLVEDLTTSYKLLAAKWEGRYHYEALSKGLAPEDMPNFIKQRGTWALDTLRLFFWDNPLSKKGLTFRQKLHFLETPLFYLNGIATLILIIVTSLSLFFEVWPTTKDAITHAFYLLPSFVSLELYFLLLGENIPIVRYRQLWAGLAPVFAIAALKAVSFGPFNKPAYKVTRKVNEYGNYLTLVLPQIAVVTLIGGSLMKIVISTPLYSSFDWATVFWGFYQATFFIQTIKISWWKWDPEFSVDISIDEFSRVARARLKNLSPQYVLQGLKSIFF